MDKFIISRDGNLTAVNLEISAITKGPHVNRVPIQTISNLAPFGALIISIIFVIYFAVRFYILEGFLLRKIYGKTYTQMDETTRRGFVNHHIAGVTKILILIVAAYPFIAVAFGTYISHTLSILSCMSHFVSLTFQFQVQVISTALLRVQNMLLWETY
jgi:hypothetical protein